MAFKSYQKWFLNTEPGVSPEYSQALSQKLNKRKIEKGLSENIKFDLFISFFL